MTNRNLDPKPADPKTLHISDTQTDLGPSWLRFFEQWNNQVGQHTDSGLMITVLILKLLFLFLNVSVRQFF